MKSRLSLLFLVLVVVTTFEVSAWAEQSGSRNYRVTKTISVPGDEGWDYLTVDSVARRVYVSHSSHVVVLDADTNALVGNIPDTQGVHGIAIVPDAGRGLLSRRQDQIRLRICQQWPRQYRHHL